MNERTWTISNILSITRIILVLPIILLLLSEHQHHRFWAVGMIGVASLTDMFDGMLARALHQETDLGRILDPLADKIAVAAIAIVLAIQQLIPFWFLAFIIVRDLLILAGGIYVKKTKNIILQSNTIGKWAVAVIVLYSIVSTLNLDSLADVKTLLLITSTAMLGASFALYAQRFFRVIHQK